jgi:integrase
MNGSLYLRGKVWWISFNRNGKQFRMSAGTDIRSKAEGKLKQEIRKALSPTFSPPNTRRITVKELIDDLVAHYRRHGKTKSAEHTEQIARARLDPFFEGIRAVDVMTSTLNAYRDKYHSPELCHTSINYDLQTLRRAYRLASEHEPPKVERVPKFPMMTVDNARKVFVTDEQVTKFRQAAAKEGLATRVLVELAFLLGWRKSEMLTLRVSDVSLAERTVRLQKSKNGDSREAPLTEGLCALLAPLVLGRQPEDQLIVLPLKFRAVWKRLCKVVGVAPDRSGLTLHDFRRTAARSKRAAGVPETVVMSLQGWRTSKMFQRYDIVSNEDKLKALDKMERIQLGVGNA